MASTKEIRTKIKSVQNTRKITKAMEMVAASKMRKSQERMRHTRPYSEKIHEVVGRLMNAHTDYKHPYLVERDEVKNVGFIVVTSDKGLCGALNTNLLRAVLGKMKEYHGSNTGIKSVAFGSKGLSFLQRAGIEIKAQVVHLGDAPHIDRLIGAVKVMLSAYEKGEIDRLYICYSKFINTMKQEAVIEPMLPLPPNTFGAPTHGWDYLYEPSPAELIDGILERFVEMSIYQAVIENLASEQSARMVAMKSASDNASTLIGELQLVYNKTRQAAITKELAEIVGGAAAV